MNAKKVLKIAGAIGGSIGLLVPLWGAMLQYQQSVQQNLDQNFRSIVENLSSENKENRLASAANMGTFIKKTAFGKGKYYDEAVDILINRLSVEIDYNVANAINGSLEKIYEAKRYKKEYKRAIEKLLTINRNTFIQQYALENWKENAKYNYDKTLKNYQEVLDKKEETAEKDAEFENLKEEAKRKWEISYKREQDLNELSMHQQVTADAISLFLRITTSSPIEGLGFVQNIMNGIRMVQIDLSKSTFKLSTFSSSSILDTNFDGSTIIDTLFKNSNLTDSKFINCKKIDRTLFINKTSLKNVDFSGVRKFSDVFFTGADLEGAKFTGAKGLKPIYFYKAYNIDKAIFDAEFKKELDETITESKFREYIINSTLRKEDREYLFETLDDLKKNAEKTTSPGTY